MRIFAPSLVVAPVALCLLASRSDARGQLLASEPASVSQTVDGTKVTVMYSARALADARDCSARR